MKARSPTEESSLSNFDVVILNRWGGIMSERPAKSLAEAKRLAKNLLGSDGQATGITIKDATAVVYDRHGEEVYKRKLDRGAISSRS
jgi:hypothetical protein